MRPPWENADNKTLRAAFRKRAGIIGRLQSCLCAYPVVREKTSSEHHEMCPAHRMSLSERRVTLRAMLGDELSPAERLDVEMELDRLEAKENLSAPV